jgi:hypothetical protein
MGVSRPRRDLLVVDHAESTSVWALLGYVFFAMLNLLPLLKPWGSMNPNSPLDRRVFVVLLLGCLALCFLAWIRACWRIVCFDRDLDRVSVEEHWRWGTNLRVFPSSQIKAVRAFKAASGGRNPYGVQMTVGNRKRIDLDRCSTLEEAELLAAEIRNFSWRRAALPPRRIDREGHAR